MNTQQPTTTSYNPSDFFQRKPLITPYMYNPEYQSPVKYYIIPVSSDTTEEELKEILNQMILNSK